MQLTLGPAQPRRFAVGLAHLLGEGGLVHALRDAGFTVTLIDTH